jgi:hypothetical protein
MDGVSLAASVIAVILWGGYILEVKDAREEILTLQRAIKGLQRRMQDLQKSLQNDKANALPSLRLHTDITECLSDLQALEVRLKSRGGKRAYEKNGFSSFEVAPEAHRGGGTYKEP